MEVVQELAGVLRQQLEHPLAVPAIFSLATLLFAIVILYTCASAGQSRGRSPVPAAGTVFEAGVRRSTRQHKQATKYTPEKFVTSPEAAKTPRAVKTPRAAKKVEEPKEAVTVTPRATRQRTTRAAAKTPATAEPMTTRTRRGAAKTPAK